MSDQVLAAIVAVGAACLYVTGLALQQHANLRAIAAGQRSAWAVVRQPVWWLGNLIMCIGFLVHGFSLTLGSLTVVQPVQSLQIAFAVVLDAWIRKTAVTRRDWQGTGLVIAGLAAFMIIAEPQAGTAFASDGSWEWIFTAFVAVGGLLALGAWRFPGARAVLFGTLAGLVWGVQGALLKETAELVDRGLGDALTSWLLYATGVLGLVGLVAQNLAVREGRLATAAALITVVNPIVSSIIGVTAFGESMRGSAGYVVGAAVAVGVVVWGVALLSHQRAETAAEAPA